MKNGWISFIILVLLACQPEPDNLRLLDELVVVTNYDPSADFSAYTTYAIPTDTIGYFSNRSNETMLIHPNPLPRPILTQIRANMEARGYTRVDRTANPDIGINVYVVNDINLFQQVVYPNFYYPSYYGYNPYFYYYPYVATYASNTGALVIEVVDLINRTANNEVKVIWTAYMGDLVNTINRVEQSVSGIDEAFQQSPYLEK